jgi:hypothetical protein
MYTKKISSFVSGNGEFLAPVFSIVLELSVSTTRTNLNSIYTMGKRLKDVDVAKGNDVDADVEEGHQHKKSKKEKKSKKNESDTDDEVVPSIVVRKTISGEDFHSMLGVFSKWLQSKDMYVLRLCIAG